MTATSSSPADTLSRRDRFFLRLLHLFSRLPLGFLQRMGAVLGVIALTVAGKSKTAHVIRRNLEIAFPEQTPEWREQVMRTRPSPPDAAPSVSCPTSATGNS